MKVCNYQTKRLTIRDMMQSLKVHFVVFSLVLELSKELR